MRQDIWARRIAKSAVNPLPIRLCSNLHVSLILPELIDAKQLAQRKASRWTGCAPAMLPVGRPGRSQNHCCPTTFCTQSPRDAVFLLGYLFASPATESHHAPESS